MYLNAHINNTIHNVDDNKKDEIGETKTPVQLPTVMEDSLRDLFQQSNRLLTQKMHSNHNTEEPQPPLVRPLVGCRRGIDALVFSDGDESTGSSMIFRNDWDSRSSFNCQ